MIGSLINDKHVYIYGAGFAGLTFAYRLKKQGTPFTLYEKESVGGKISSKATLYGPVEAAASSLYMNADAEIFLIEMGLPFIYAKKKLKRWIWKKEGAVSPLRFSLITRVISKAFLKFPNVYEHSTVEDIFLPLLGRKYLDELLSPALQGIYAAEARDLHFLSLFPFAKNQHFSNYFTFVSGIKKNLKKDAAKKIKGSVSFEGGMQTLINHLHQEVKNHIQPLPENFVLHPNTVICTSASDAAKLLRADLPEVSQQLMDIEYRPITSLSFFVKAELPELKESFGMLIPQKFGSSLLGIIHQSEIFRSNYLAHCYSVICKGIQSEDYIYGELEKKMNGFKRSNIIEHSLSSWDMGLPLYNLKRAQAIKNISTSLQDKPGLVLFGNYTKGISLRAMLGQTRS